MLKMYDLECPECKLKTEALVEYDVDTATITEEMLCERCTTPMRPALQNAIYGRSGTWSEWNLDHRMGK